VAYDNFCLDKITAGPAQGGSPPPEGGYLLSGCPSGQVSYLVDTVPLTGLFYRKVVAVALVARVLYSEYRLESLCTREKT